MRIARLPLPMALADRPPEQHYALPPGQSVASVATQGAALRLDRANLLAVITREGVRHALVRLPDGRILRLHEGDRLQDATVAAIDNSALYLLDNDNRPRALRLDS